MNQNYYFSSPTRRGYYPRTQPYGANGYGYGNKPAIIVNPIFYCDSDTDSDSGESSSTDE
jgi:hypothetical protein